LWFYKDFAPTALRQVADDEAASGAPSGNSQTSRRRLAMTHRQGRNINAHPMRGFSKGGG